jgi:uncharacterized protein YbjT (DUF2867 family)
MILVTGAGGVVGREVFRQLLRDGRPVTAVTRAETRFPDAVRVVGGDLFSPQWLASALEGVEAIQISPPCHRARSGRDAAAGAQARRPPCGAAVGHHRWADRHSSSQTGPAATPPHSAPEHRGDHRQHQER